MQDEPRKDGPVPTRWKLSEVERRYDLGSGGHVLVEHGCGSFWTTREAAIDCARKSLAIDPKRMFAVLRVDTLLYVPETPAVEIHIPVD